MTAILLYVAIALIVTLMSYDSDREQYPLGGSVPYGLAIGALWPLWLAMVVCLLIRYSVRGET